MKKTLTRREKLIFLICCFVIGVFVLYNVGWRTVRQSIDGLEARVAAATAKLQKTYQTLSDGENYQRRYEGYQQSLAQDGTDEAVVSRLLSEIEQVSAQTGLKVSDLKPLRVRDEKYYRTFSVSITVDGSLVTTLAFIDALQQEPHRFDVTDLRMDQAQRRGEDIKTRVVVGRIYFKTFNPQDGKKSR